MDLGLLEKGKTVASFGSMDDAEATDEYVSLDKLQLELDDRQPLTGSVNGDSSRIRQSESMFLSSDDGKRIDFILAYCDQCSTDDTETSASTKKSMQRENEQRQRRKFFEDGLREQGLVLETEDKKESEDGETYFVKIHAPWDVLARHAELMKIKMPMKENDMQEETDCCPDLPRMPHPFRLSDEIIEPEPKYFTTYFIRDRPDMFIMKDKDSFFTNAQRSLIVLEILQRTKHESSGSEMGLKRLLTTGTYTAVYPLHEGDYVGEQSGADNDRRLLYETWARPGMWYKYQPTDLIRKYFGEKIAIYFTWLGFYTVYLLPAAILGLVVFLYGVSTVMNNVPSNDICNRTGVGSLVMCPLCDGRCNYWELGKSCTYSRVSYLFDNSGTVLFAVFMSLWAAMFLEFWKRRQAAIQYDWDVADFEQEEGIRPEYMATVRTTRINPVTKTIEPHMSLYSRIPRITGSVLVVVFMMCLVLAAVFAVILYSTIMVTLLYASGDEFLKTNAKIATTATAGVLNLIIIVLLSMVYEKIAFAMTNFENPKTDTEFNDQFAVKMFLFEFVNYYSPIFYVAFFKGKLADAPSETRHYIWGRFRAEECDPGGCLIELCVQLAIVMIGKQIGQSFMEIGMPALKNYYRRRTPKQQAEGGKNVYTRWERDYDLEMLPPRGMFDEYLELVIQYGFITVFVAAFPLAPLFALINNIVEVRLDAFRLVTQYRRPIAVRAQSIGIWYTILAGLSRVAIFTNALIIATTSQFIPKFVYVNFYSPDGTLNGFMANSLSVFRIQDFKMQSVPEHPGPEYEGLTECYYQDYRHSPGGPNQYQYTMQYWHILAARIIFVIVFEHVVMFATWLIDIFIPDMPGDVKERMLRGKYLVKEALYTADALRQRKNVPNESTRPPSRDSTI